MQERSDSYNNRSERRHSPKRRNAEDIYNELLEVYFPDDHEPTRLYIFLVHPSFPRSTNLAFVKCCVIIMFEVIEQTSHPLRS